MGKWRGPRTARDPLLTTPQWRAIRKHWIALGLPCALCRGYIEYDKARRLINGRENPRYLVVGHIVSRRRAKLAGWTEDQINALSNTRPECKRCSNKSGAREGQQAQHAKANRRKVLNTSREW